MASFDLNETQQQVQELARTFSKEQVSPGAIERDIKSEFPHDQIKQAAELGFLGVTVGEEWNGVGLDNLSQCIIIEEISRFCASTAVVISVQNSLVNWILNAEASDDIKERYLKKLTTGELLGAYCLSEPEAGSDARGIKTVAKKDGDNYIINGMKNWITNGSNADTYIVFAKTNPELGHKGITAFVVDADSEGIEVGVKEDKMGLRGSDTVSIGFTNVSVPKENIIGAEGQGFYIAMKALAGGRIGIASQALGIAQGAFDLAVKYAGERQTMGVTINQHQAIQFKLAEMSTKISAARLLIYKAAWMKDNDMNPNRESSEAKLYASKIANEVAKEAVQIHGGYGYVREYQVERMMRDAKITEIYEGTSEIQHIVIARDVIKNAE